MNANGQITLRDLVALNDAEVIPDFVVAQIERGGVYAGLCWCGRPLDRHSGSTQGDEPPDHEPMACGTRYLHSILGLGEPPLEHAVNQHGEPLAHQCLRCRLDRWRAGSHSLLDGPTRPGDTQGGQDGPEPSLDPCARFGPFLTAEAAAALFGVDQSALDRARERRRVLGARTSDGGWLYPAWQFTSDGNLLPGLEEVLGVLLRVVDEWTAVRWLRSPSPTFEGFSAAVLLRDDEFEPVIEAARRDAARWSQ